MSDTQEQPGITDSELEAAIDAVIKTHGVAAPQAALVLGTMCDHYTHFAQEPVVSDGKT